MRSAIALSDAMITHQRFCRGGGVWSACSALLLGTALLTAGPNAAVAQDQPRLSRAQQEALRNRQNESTLIVATSHPTASHFAMAHDIASAIGKSSELRLLPISSGGGVETLRDLLFLRGVDMAIVPANALAQAKATESLGPGLVQRVAYITRLTNEEVHLLVGRNAKALAKPRVRDAIVKMAAEPAGGSPGDFGKFLGAQLAHWSKVVKESGIKIGP